MSKRLDVKVDSMASGMIHHRFHRGWFVFIAATVALIFLSVCWASDDQTRSVCYGTPSQGRLENGWQLPAEGKNFVAYSSMGRWLQRTYVHSIVYQTILDAFQALAGLSPAKTFMYGETGWKNGGSFKPHKAHQNGTSVDFMVPVLNAKGESVPLPTSIGNKFGYGIDFDEQGVFQEYRIDFEAIGKHLRALIYAAKKTALPSHG